MSQSHTNKNRYYHFQTHNAPLGWSFSGFSQAAKRYDEKAEEAISEHSPEQFELYDVTYENPTGKRGKYTVFPSNQRAKDKHHARIMRGIKEKIAHKSPKLIQLETCKNCNAQFSLDELSDCGMCDGGAITENMKISGTKPCPTCHGTNCVCPNCGKFYNAPVDQAIQENAQTESDLRSFWCKKRFYKFDYAHSTEGWTQEEFEHFAETHDRSMRYLSFSDISQYFNMWFENGEYIIKRIPVFVSAMNGQFRHVENRSVANRWVRSANHAIVLGSYVGFRIWGEKWTPELGEEAKRLSERIRRYINYIREIYPQWEDVGTPAYYADNSVSQEQYSPILDKYRNIRITPPSGDRCF